MIDLSQFKIQICVRVFHCDGVKEVECLGRRLLGRAEKKDKETRSGAGRTRDQRSNRGRSLSSPEVIKDLRIQN